MQHCIADGRRGFGLAIAAMALAATCHAQTAPAPVWPDMGDATVVLFRHASAPGGGDPAGFDLRDCRTQRNLDDGGRAQARRIGDAFRARTIHVTAVLTSQWCRARDSANLAFPATPASPASPALPREAAEFNSFFEQGDKGAKQTAQAMERLKQWKGPGVMVVFTHQVNITALTGIFPASGEGVVVRADDNRLRVLGRIQP